MKKISAFISVVILLFSFISCNLKDKSDAYLIETNIVKYHTVRKISIKDTNRVYDPMQLALVNDSTFIFNEYKGNYLITFWNLKTGHIIDSIAKVGKGPSEVIPPVFIYTFNDTIEIASKRSLRYLIYVNNNNIKTYNISRTNFSKFVRITDSIFVGKGYFEKGRIALTNENNFKKANTFCNFPHFKNFDKFNDFLISFIFDGPIICDYSRKKVAFAGYNTGTLEFFKIFNNDSIVELKQYKFLADKQIKIANSSSGQLTSAKYSDDSYRGFSDIYRTKKYFYALWNGKKRSQYKAGQGCNTILCFDWNGNYIKTIKLDKAIDIFAVSADDSFIVGYKSENKVYILKKK